MSAMLSYPDRQLLWHIAGKLPFVHLMNERQVTMAEKYSLYVWKVLVSGHYA